jgi:hypothetical protein
MYAFNSVFTPSAVIDRYWALLAGLSHQILCHELPTRPSQYLCRRGLPLPGNRTVSMDYHQPARRSASHGPLDQNYTVEAQQRFYPSTPFLLTSPAPLESMLKKTTETGDIGLFSISPVRSTSASHVPRRPRAGWAEVITEPSPISSVEALDLIDDRRSLPSYRDSTSEIVSLDEFDSIYPQPQPQSAHEVTRGESSTASMDERADKLSSTKRAFRDHPNGAVSYDFLEDTHGGLTDVPPVSGHVPATPPSGPKNRQADVSG